MCIPFVLYFGLNLLLSWGDGKESKFESSFTTELGDDFEVYFVKETVFLKVDDYFELRQKGENNYLIQTVSPVTKDDFEVIADEKHFRAYRVCGTIIYSQDSEDFRVLRQLTDANGRLVEYVRKNLLSSYGFMSEYFFDYVILYPEERELIIEAIENNQTGVLEKYGYTSDAKQQETIRKELWRYKPYDDSSTTK